MQCTLTPDIDVKCAGRVCGQGGSIRMRYARHSYDRSASGVFGARCGLSAYQATGVFLTQGSRDSSMGMGSSSMETVCEVEFLSALHAADGVGFGYAVEVDVAQERETE